MDHNPTAQLLCQTHSQRPPHCQLLAGAEHRQGYLRLDQLCVVKISGTCSEAGFFLQACSHPQLIQLVLNAKANCPPAEGAVKGVGDV